MRRGIRLLDHTMMVEASISTDEVIRDVITKCMNLTMSVMGNWAFLFL